MKSSIKRTFFHIPLATFGMIFLFPLSSSAWTQDAELCYRTHGNIDLKISYCTKAIESGLLNSLDLSTTYANRGLAYADRADREHALADFDAAIRIKPDNGQALVARGNFYRFLGEETKAHADYNAAIAVPIPPEARARPYLDRSRAYLAKGDLTSALTDLNTANRLDPSIREVYELRGDIYYRRKDFHSAIDEFSGALKLNPKDAEMLNNRALAYLNLSEFENALADCDAAINADQYVAEYYSHRAVVRRILGEQDLSIADYGVAIQLDPNHGSRYAARATAYRQNGDWKDAMADYDRAVQAEPTRGIYRAARADEREYEGDYDGALTDRDEAIVRDPSNADLRIGRAWTLLYMGRTDEALGGFDDAIRIDPKAAGRYRSRALALTKLGRYEEALADYDQAAKIEPARGINYSSRAYVAMYRGQPLAALPDIERGRIADPEYAEAANWIGVVRIATMDFDEAIRAFTKYIESRPNTSLGFDNRGFARMLNGDYEGAAADFHKSFSFNIWVPSTMLWLHWSNLHLGKDDHDELAKNATRVDPKRWPGPALRFALGQIPTEEMLAAAKDPSDMVTKEQEADAYFEAGEYYLSIHDAGNAQKMFLEVLSRNQHYSVAEFGAKAELNTLKK
jgi:tetratricopeptide (TPR) repeat protein